MRTLETDLEYCNKNVNNNSKYKLWTWMLTTRKSIPKVFFFSRWELEEEVKKDRNLLKIAQL